ncbi:MAG: PQQ-binding-like beta-propeller repeat protein [Candidatus Bathyarchaeia archaeon]
MNIQKTKFNKNKTATSFALILLLTLSVLTAVAQPASAQAATSTSATYAFITVNPNPIGVGQMLQVSFWLTIPPPTAVADQGDRWQGFSVTITKPDGTTELKSGYSSDAVGAAFFVYYPTLIGTYKFQMSFPGQTLTNNITYLPSQSNIASLVVQQESVAQVQDHPLPTSYWTRPLNAQNYAWSQISSNWLMAAWDTTGRSFDQGNAYAKYATAPDSAHVLWTKSLTFGGLIGAEYGATAFHNGMSYEQFFKPPVIINGYLYYNSIGAQEPVTSYSDSGIPQGIVCVDMKTGETVFTIANQTLSFGQIYNYVSPNQGGGLAYLWVTSGTTWKMYDAWTGSYILTIANVTSGTMLLDNTYDGGPGDILVYNFNSNTNQLTLWNSSLIFDKLNALQGGGGPGSTPNSYSWRAYYWTTRSPIDGNLGIQWVKTLGNVPTGGSMTKVGGYENTVYISNGTASGFGATEFVKSWCGYSMTDGSLLWGPTTIDISTHIPPNATAFTGAVSTEGISIIFVRETMQSYAWNVKTGQFLWGPTEAYSNPWGYVNWEEVYIINGIYYNSGYDGMIHAFDALTGDLLWEFSSGDAGTITPYGTWPFYQGLTIAGLTNTLIATTGEHGNGVQPLYQGEAIYALDATTGTQLWNMTGWFCQPALADGRMVTQNLYDNQIYCFGKGPSATTVSAPQTAIVKGHQVTIAGSVTDQSPGAKDTPAIADEYQGEWMNYIYQQQPMPTNAKGVIVTLSTFDPNGNTYIIGTTTTDLNGNYGIMWTPPVEGLYQIIATFSGSDSYYGSDATTYMSVEVAPDASPTTAPTSAPTSAPTAAPTVSPSVVPEPEAAPSTDMYVIAAAAAVIIVVAAVAAVILRKRK